MTVKNVSTIPQTWTVRVPVKGTMQSSYSANFTVDGTDWVWVGQQFNATLAPGASTDFGYCAAI